MPGPCISLINLGSDCLSDAVRGSFHIVDAAQWRRSIDGNVAVGKSDSLRAPSRYA